MDAVDIGSLVLCQSLGEDELTLTRRPRTTVSKNLSYLQLKELDHSLDRSTKRRAFSCSAGEASQAVQHRYGSFPYAPLDEPQDTSVSKGGPMKIVKGLLVDCIAGVIAFLLSSTIAISCATVITGHGSPLSAYVSNLIDMNFLGTAVLCLFLAWKSSSPWVLGTTDVFV
jgi:hypothetical protein